MKKCKILVNCLCFCTIFMATLTPNVCAYNLSHYPMSDPVFGVKNHSYSTSYTNAFNAAADSWNSRTRAYVHLGEEDNSVFNLQWNGSITEIGLTEAYGSSKNHADYVVITMNNANIDGKNKSQTYKQGAICHELGHCFGLDDNTGLFTTRCIMNYYTDLNTTYVPQQDDLNGFNAVYN